MLRRNILTSAMASVMALTSISAVAFADETATDVKNVKTKADLEAFVKEMVAFRDKSLDDYGSVTQDNFLNALAFAENVLDDAASTIDDYTSAYMILESVYNKKAIYTASDLRDLVKSCEKIYESNNILNEDLGDAIYKDEDGKLQWSNFSNAFEEAESVLRSSDSRIITDAYETLSAAKSNLATFDTVTKAQFRTNLRALETALKKEYAYNAWQTGTVGGDYSWAFGDEVVAYGQLVYWAQGQMANIKAQYDALDSYKSVSKTSVGDIVEAAAQAERFANIINNFKPTDTTRGSKASVQKLIKQYNGQLVHDYATTAAEDLFKLVADKTKNNGNYALKVYNDIDGISGQWVDIATSDANPWYVAKGSAKRAVGTGMNADAQSVTKDIDVSISVKPTKGTFYIILNDEGYVDLYNEDNSVNEDVVTTTKPSGKKYKIVNKNSEVDLTDYIKVYASDIVDAASPVDNHEINEVNDGDTYTVTGGDFWMHLNADGTVDDTKTSGIHPVVVGGWALTAFKSPWASWDGDHTNSADESVKDYTTLDTAFALAEFYLTTTDKETIKDQTGLTTTIYDIDNTGAIAENSAKASSTEWNLVYSYLKRALEDKYSGNQGTHTKADVEKLIEDCYDLADLTGDTAMFKCRHTELVTARQNALAWLRLANKDKKYSENVSAFAYNGNEAVANTVYDSLKGYYDALEKEYKAFKYSFGEIYYKLAEIADLLDSGKLEMTDAIKTGMSDVAYKLSTVASLDDAVGVTLENDAFSSDGYINKINRLYTNGAEFKNFKFDEGQFIDIPKPDDSGDVKSHDNLKVAYESLLTEINKQLNPDAKLGDVNKDGAINAIDAALILKAAADGTVDTLDKAVADFNTDGAINALDAAAILKGVAAGTLK